MERPESTLGVILALILMSECVFFPDLSLFFDFCFSVLFFDAEKHAKAPYDKVGGYPVYPLKTCVSMGLSKH